MILPRILTCLALLSSLCSLPIPATASTLPSVVLPRASVKTTLSLAVSATTNTIITQAATHYSILQPNVEVSITEIPSYPTFSGSQLAFESLGRGEVDAIFTTLIATPAQKAAAPDIVHFPVFAFGYGPTYNLPTVDVNKPVVFSFSVLAKIFSGNITKWNDPRLAALNPTITLPNHDILMVFQTESGAFLQLFTRALRSVDAEFASLVKESSAPKWPLSRYAQYAIVQGGRDPASFVAANRYSLNISPLSYISQLSASMGAMVNRDNVVVQPSFKSVHAAFSSQSITSTFSNDSTGITYNPTDAITNAPGEDAWPFVVEGTLSLPIQYSRLSCVHRAELVKFLLFMLNSDSIQYELAASQYAAILTATLDAAIGLRSLLNNGMYCSSFPVNIPSKNNALLGVATPTSTHASSGTVFLAVYDSKDLYITYQFISMNEMDQLTNLLAGPTLINNVSTQLNSAWVMPFTFTRMWPGVLEVERNAGQLSFFPSGVFAVWPSYHLHSNITAAMQSMNALPLQVDEETLGKLYTGQIQSWLDKAFLTFNPKLADAFAANPLVSPAISLVLYGKGDKATSHLSALSNHMVVHLNRTDAFQRSGITWSLPADWTQLTSKLDAIGMKYYYMRQELEMESFISLVDNSIGYIYATNNNPDPTSIFSIVRYYQPEGALTKTPLVLRPSAEATKACVDNADIPAGDHPLIAVTFDSLLNGIPSNAAAASCWPFTILTNLVVKTSVHDVANGASISSAAADGTTLTSTANSIITAQNANFCFFHKGIVHFLDWLMTDQSTFNPSHSLGRQPFVESTKYQDLYQAELNALKCGGEYLLFTPAFAWILAYNVKAFAYSISIIGMLGTVVACYFLFRHRNRTIIRASGWLLQTISIVGILLLLISSLILTFDHTNSLCSGVSWTSVIGFTLTIAPQVLKIYRIYYTVIKHDNHHNHHQQSDLKQKGFGTKKIYMVISALLAIDVALLALAESREGGLLHPATTVIFTDHEEHDYVSCSPTDNGLPIAIVAYCSKAALILYGSYCAFRIRHVSNAFGESTKISWSLWSMSVCCVIVVPIIKLTGSDYGDLFTFLVIFLILWITYSSVIFQFGYKLLAISSEAWREYKQQQLSSGFGHSALHSTRGSHASLQKTVTGAKTSGEITGTGTGTGTFSFGSSGTATRTGSYIFPSIPTEVSIHRLEKYIDALEYQLLKAKERQEKEHKDEHHHGFGGALGALKAFTNRFHHNHHDPESRSTNVMAPMALPPPAPLHPIPAFVRGSPSAPASRRVSVASAFHIEISKAEPSSKYAVHHDPPSKSDAHHHGDISSRDHSHLALPSPAAASSSVSLVPHHRGHAEEHGSLGELAQLHLAHHNHHLAKQSHAHTHLYQPLNMNHKPVMDDHPTSPPVVVRRGSHSGTFAHSAPMSTRTLPPRVTRASTSNIHSIEFINTHFLENLRENLSPRLETIHSPEPPLISTPNHIVKNDNSPSQTLSFPLSFHAP